MNTKDSILNRMRELVDEMEAVETAQSQFQTGDLVTFQDDGSELVGLVEAYDDVTLTVRVQAVHGEELEPTDDVRSIPYEEASPYPKQEGETENEPAPDDDPDPDPDQEPTDEEEEETPPTKGAWVCFNTPEGLVTGRIVDAKGDDCNIEVYQSLGNEHEPTGVIVTHKADDVMVRRTEPTVAPRTLMVKINDLSFDGEDEKVGHIKGYASTYGNVDLGGDMVMKGAFTQTLYHKKNRVKLFLDHYYRVKDVAGLAYLQDDEKGLALSGELPIHIPSVKEIHDKIKFLNERGEDMGLSIGYDIVKAKMRDDGVRELKEIALGEVSITPFPMNTEATILNAKARKIGYQAKKSVWRKIVRETKTTDAPVGNQLSQGDITSLVTDTATFIQTLKSQ